jgi:hypothetical protein
MRLAITPPRFQFTIRGLMLATFWAAVSCAAWTLFYRFPIAWEETWGLQACLFVAIGSAVVAAGAVLNKAKLACVMMLIAVGGTVTLWVVRGMLN